MSRKIRGVLFDFGGTLFAHPGLAETVAIAARRLGANWDVARCAEVAAGIDRLAMLPAEIARGRDLDAGVWRDRWHDLYAVADGEVPGLGAEIYRQMHDPATWIPYRDAVWTLRGLMDAEIPIGVISNTGWDVRSVFRQHGVGYCVNQFVLSYEVGLVKPEAGIFGLAVDALLCSADDVLMVGDDPVADAGAARCGMRTLLLPQTPPASDNGIAAVLALASA